MQKLLARVVEAHVELRAAERAIIAAQKEGGLSSVPGTCHAVVRASGETYVVKLFSMMEPSVFGPVLK